MYVSESGPAYVPLADAGEYAVVGFYVMSLLRLMIFVLTSVRTVPLGLSLLPSRVVSTYVVLLGAVALGASLRRVRMRLYV